MEILALIFLLLGLGVMIGGFAFVRRIFAVASGCIQALIGVALAMLIAVLIAQAACSAVLH